MVHVFCIAAGAMISSGLFVLPDLVHAKAGPAVILSYLVAALLAATGMLSTAEMATAMPRAGSDHFFITRSMGPAIGLVAGLFNWVSFSLEAEPTQIIRDRDRIIIDRFDQIVENCVVVDTTAILTAQDLFGVAAERLSARLGMDRQAIFDALAAREQQSSTVIGPGLAVPHVVVEGALVCNILLARSHSGFFFSADRPAVHCVFVLIGSRDERNFHLQALAAMAHIVQEPGFEKRRSDARGEQGLRDLVLLGSRRIS